MKNRSIIRLSVLLTLILCAPLSGQEKPQNLTLEDIYKNGTYPTRNYRSVRWMEVIPEADEVLIQQLNRLQITHGDFDVVQLDCIQPKSGYVYYIASPDNFTQRYLYRSKINGKGEPERISPDDQDGQHSYVMSGDAKWALHTFQNASTPPVISLMEVKSSMGTIVAVNRVGRAMPRELRCTALGGLATTPSAKKIEEQLRNRE
jgi:hypothetical protein